MSQKQGSNIMALMSFDRETVEQFTRNFESLFDAGDAESMASFYAEDAKLMAEDTEMIQGRTAIEQFWRIACEGVRAVKARRNITLQEITTSGNFGYGLGTVTVRVPQTGGQERQITFKYATIWRREADGQWRLVVDISNRNSPRDQRDLR
jgi:uncharacterized protein (TIGR02246 family)